MIKIYKNLFMMNKYSGFLVVTGLTFILMGGCKKDNDTAVPGIVIQAVHDVNATSAVVEGEITGDGGAAVTARGVCWDVTPNPTTVHNKTSDGSGVGHFTSSIDGLEPGTTYYVRAYAVNTAGTAYSSQQTINTGSTYATVSTNAVPDPTFKSAVCGGKITNDGGSQITERGICWSTTEAPTIYDEKIAIGNGTGTFSTTLDYLSQKTTYYVRAYAVNNAGTAYGNEVSFTTDENLPTVPSVKSVSSYDFEGRRTEEVFYKWNAATSSWENDTKVTYEYFAYNKEWEDVISYWDEAESQWKNFNKFTNYFKNTNDNTLHRTINTWSHLDWEEYDSYNYTFTFDNQSRISQQIETDTEGYWDENGGMWRYYIIKTDFKYDSKGIEIEAKVSSWHPTYGWSDPGYYSEFTYDQNGNPTERLVYSWSSEAGDFIQTEKYVYTYDSNGFQESYIMYTGAPYEGQTR